jgi:hypothetical protein
LFLIRYYYDRQIKVDENGRACRMHRGDENAYNILVTKPEGRLKLGRPSEVGMESMDWLHLAENRDRWLVLVTLQ